MYMYITVMVDWNSGNAIDGCILYYNLMSLPSAFEHLNTSFLDQWVALFMHTESFNSSSSFCLEICLVMILRLNSAFWGISFQGCLWQLSLAASLVFAFWAWSICFATIAFGWVFIFKVGGRLIDGIRNLMSYKISMSSQFCSFWSRRKEVGWC